MRLLRAFATVLALATAALPSVGLAQSWNRVRDTAMTLREKGQVTQAYSLVTSTRSERAIDEVDRQFVAGFLALRVLGRADVALGHFQQMAYGTTKLRGQEQTVHRSMAGYWIGRSLQALGRTAEARKLYEAGALYRDTFYGLMSASQAGLSDTSTAIAPLAQNYPRPRFFWTDPRVRPELVLAVIKPESNFNPSARSGAGARGLMQLMPDTARRVGRKAGVEIDMNLVAHNADYNVILGTKHFGDLLEMYGGNIMLAAAAYNAGEERANEWLRRFGDPRKGQIDAVDFIELIPFKETRTYVKRVVGYYVAYVALSSLTASK